jgi:hypothetical protein
MEWYLPTFYGDISLVAREKGTTILKVTRMTPKERLALATFRKRALRSPFGCKPWATAEAFITLDSPSYLEASGGVEIELDVDLDTARNYLARQLKPDRKLVNAVLFKDGTLTEAAFTEPAAEGAEGTTEPRVLASAAPPPANPAPAAQEPSRRPVAGTTVAAPTRGCPAPDFSAAELRAAHVLSHFLTAEQLIDFRLYNRFISIGATTGHRYMLTSRFRRAELGKYGGRSLYDLDEQRGYCVHDWTVPAAEELLGLHVFLQLPGKEAYLREIPEE